jgi:polyisoprenyl-teichoic acid--peptidoglycan teichoic acid transferase
MVANSVQASRARHRRRARLVALVLAIIVIAAGSYIYYERGHVAALVADTVGRNVMPGVFVTPIPRTRTAGGEQQAPAFPDWDKQERVNIMLLGLDTRDKDHSLSDTIIVVSIDPATKTIAMLSIPRDLWVPIPGFGEHKINAAYSLGEQGGQTGGGAALVEQTVEENFGIPIHYFAQVDFQGFEGIVNTIGGVTIDVKKPIKDDAYPTNDYGYTRIYIPAGVQHMDGTTALQYARSRHSEDDLGRNQRQQAVIMAVRDQGLKLNLLPKLGEILGEINGMFRTDLSLTQVGSLAQLTQKIGTSEIYSRTIDWTMVSDFKTSTGEDALMPNWTVINPLVNSMFNDVKLAREGATVAVVNGTNTSGLAGKVADSLKLKGFNVVSVEQAPDAGEYLNTEIQTYNDAKTYTVEKLKTIFNVSAANVTPATDARQGVDIVVVLGNDAALVPLN